jgi:membrane-associated phospholipid phosphatase
MVVKRIVILLLLALPVDLSSQNIDISLLRRFNSPDALASDNFFRFISNSDPFIVFAVPVCMAGSGYFTHDEKLIRNGCVTLASTAVCGGITIVMKYAIDRNRPFVTYPDIMKKSKAISPSFPSGHTASSFATATSVSLAYPKWYIIVPSFAWAGTVGYSRMHLGVHYPSDVLAGALIGSGCAWLTFKVNRQLSRKPGQLLHR